MSTNISYNGVTYTIPAYDDVEWGEAVTAYLIAIPAGMLTKAGGSWHLTDADLDLGSAYGLASLYLKSKTSTIANSGFVRMAKTDFIAWRNAGNSDDNKLGTTTDLLTWNTVEIPTISSTSTLTNKTVDVDLNTFSNIRNSNIAADAAIDYVKLNLTGSIVNTDIAAVAGIDYTKLALTDSIVDADINSAAAIAYSKLDLAGKLKDADWSADPADKLSAAKIESDFGAGSVVTAGTFKVGDNPYVSVKATPLANYDFKLPEADGVAGQALVRSVLGPLEWASIPGLALQQYFVMVGDSSNLPTGVNTSTLGDIGANETTGFTIKALAVDNSHVKAAAAIALTKLAALATGSRALASDATGFIVESATTAAELGFVSGVTSAIQTQLNTASSSISGKMDITSLVPFTVNNAPNPNTTGTASQINTINPNTKGLVIKASNNPALLPVSLKFLAKFTTNATADVATGSATGTLVNAAVVTGGELDCTPINANAYYSAVGNFDFPQIGTIRFNLKTGYSGSPASDSSIFYVKKTDGGNNENSEMGLYHRSNSNLQLLIRNNAGGVIIYSPMGAWVPVSGTSYNFELDYDLTVGATRLFIDGIQSGSTMVGTGTRNSTDLLFLKLSAYSGSSDWGKYKFDDIALFNTVQHTANFNNELPYEYGNQTANLLEVQDYAGTSLTTINNKGALSVPSVIFNALTAQTVPYVDASKQLKSSAVTDTELGYLSAVTSSIQTQLNAKAPSSTAVTLTGAQVVTNKDIDGGTASNTSRITIPKNTSANLTSLTRKQGTILYDTDAQKLKVDDGTSLKVVGGGLIPVAINKTYATTLESGKHYLLDAATAAADITLNLPAGATEADIKVSVYNIPTGYKVIIAPNGAEKIFYNDTDNATVEFVYAETEQWAEFVWNGTKWLVNDNSNVLSGTFSGALTFTGPITPSGGISSYFGATGNVGETITNKNGSAVTIYTGSFVAAATLELTAGKWLVSGSVAVDGSVATTSTGVIGSLDLKTNSVGAGGSYGTDLLYSSGHVAGKAFCVTFAPQIVTVASGDEKTCSVSIKCIDHDNVAAGHGNIVAVRLSPA